MMVQDFVSGILYHACAVDLTVFVALFAITSKQAKALSKKTIENMGQLLQYLATHPDVKMRFYTSDMILNVHSDVSYFSIPGDNSRACGHFFLSWMIRTTKQFNEMASLCPYHHPKFCGGVGSRGRVRRTILERKRMEMFQLTLTELGHLQPTTCMYCDNVMAAGIAIGLRRSRGLG